MIAHLGAKGPYTSKPPGIWGQGAAEAHILSHILLWLRSTNVVDIEGIVKVAPSFVDSMTCGFKLPPLHQGFAEAAEYAVQQARRKQLRMQESAARCTLHCQ